MDIQYGLKITTRQTTITDYSIGCINGVIRWITGRPAVDMWKEGLITKDSLSEISKEIEISSGGSYGTMSGGSVSVDNAFDIAFLIRSLGINLIQSDVIFYTFRDGVETQDWTGKVADWSFDEDEIKIHLMDSFRGIHKNILGAAIGGDAFPLAPKESIGKSIPLSIGKISHAKLINIKDESEKISCATVSGVNYKFCAATEYPVGSPANYSVIKLKTQDLIFSANDLLGKTLLVIHGGVSQSRKITGNSASSSGVTQAYIDRKFDLSTAFVAWNSGTGNDLVWYFEITDNKSNFAVNKNPVYSFEYPASSINNYNSFVEIFKSSTKRFSKILGIDFDYSLTDIDGTGYPGFTLKTKASSSNGKSIVYTAIKPSSIVITSKNIAGTLTSYTDGLGSVSSSPSNLIDRSHSTGYSFAWSITNTASYPGPVFDVTYQITIPQDIMEEEFSDIYLLPDIICTNGGISAQNHYVLMTISSVDFYGRSAVPVVLEFEIIETQVIGLIVAQYHNFIIDNYFISPPGISGHFGKPWSSGSLYADTYNFSCKDIVSNIAKLGIYNKFDVKFRIHQQDGIGSISNSVFDIREIGLVSPYEFDLSKESFYIKIIGELFGTTWDARKTAANPVSNIADAVELIIRNFDGNSDVIDATAFDLLSHASTGTRKNWNIGRQITTESNSFDLIQDLCVFGMFGMVPKNNGKRAIVDWLSGASVATHDESNVIQGSIGSRMPTSLSNVYNDMQVNYAWNPETDKADLVLKITKIDDASFPLEATLDSNGVDLWKSYAIGYNDDEYAQAKVNWDYCHDSYLKYGVTQALPANMADAKWFPDIEGDWSVASTGNAAKLYMSALCSWAPFRKDVIKYRLPNTSTHSTLELLDKITFNDSVMTEGNDVDGWIVRKSIVPGEGRDYIEISLMLEVGA